ncbi:hypothetical protein PIB30_081308 [Stylosanthes scabra]|uniref:Uncharacterized protein n=1 Tax=Stylosanthes scabra TaxID=79078 RepID=A0ABU6UQG9_9FABA|nr:hypothetical protein [Stylosanthes scabra]
MQGVTDIRHIHLTRIMRDFMYHASDGPRDQRLPLPILITRLAVAYEVGPFPEDEYLDILSKDTDCPFGDSKGEKRKARKAKIPRPSPPSISPPLVHPHSPQAQPSALASDIPTSSTTQPLDPFQQIMKMSRRLEPHDPHDTPDMQFTELLQVSSPEPELAAGVAPMMMIARRTELTKLDDQPRS